MCSLLGLARGDLLLFLRGDFVLGSCIQDMGSSGIGLAGGPCSFLGLERGDLVWSILLEFLITGVLAEDVRSFLGLAIGDLVWSLESEVRGGGLWDDDDSLRGEVTGDLLVFSLRKLARGSNGGL